MDLTGCSFHILEEWHRFELLSGLDIILDEFRWNICFNIFMTGAGARFGMMKVLNWCYVPMTFGKNCRPVVWSIVEIFIHSSPPFVCWERPSSHQFLELSIMRLELFSYHGSGECVGEKYFCIAPIARWNSKQITERICQTSIWRGFIWRGFKPKPLSLSEEGLSDTLNCLVVIIRGSCKKTNISSNTTITQQRRQAKIP